MSLWKIQDGKPQRVEETKLGSEQMLELDLEEWLARDPAILGEPLLIIGRQVQVKALKDRLDLLALDPDGNAVVIEVKRGDVKDPNDMQALRYASYLSRWKFADFEAVARDYLGKEDSDFNFVDAYESFCSEHLEDTEESPTPNQDQRIILIGERIRDRLGSVALWLREHKVDIKLVEVAVFKENGDLFLEPITIVPVSVSRFDSVGVGAEAATKPWKEDGQAWHLERRCNASSRAMLQSLVAALEQISELEGPNWSQKYYISYHTGAAVGLTIETGPKVLVVNIRVPKGSIEASQVAGRLGIEVFQTDVTLSDKLALSSSVGVSEAASNDTVKIRCKEGFEFTEDFVDFVRECLQVTA